MKRHILLTILSITLVLSISCFSVLAMTDEQKNQCHMLIHSAATSAAGSSVVLAQAPGADNIALVVIVGAMTIGLADIFDVSITESANAVGTKVLSDFAWKITMRAASQWAVGWIPFIGNAINAATMAWLVEDIGWEVADALDTGNWQELLLP